jgi:hypothetical protein
MHVQESRMNRQLGVSSSSTHQNSSFVPSVMKVSILHRKRSFEIQVKDFFL